MTSRCQNPPQPASQLKLKPLGAELAERWESRNSWCFDVFFFKKHQPKTKKTCFGRIGWKGKLLMASEKSSRPCSCFRTTISSRPNPSRNEDTASFLGHIPGVSELNGVDTWTIFSVHLRQKFEENNLD